MPLTVRQNLDAGLSLSLQETHHDCFTFVSATTRTTLSENLAALGFQVHIANLPTDESLIGLY